MDRATVLKAFETNLWDRASFLAKSRKDAEVQDSQDLLVVDSCLPCKLFNTIGRSALHPRFGLDRIDAAIKRFRSKSAPFTWVLDPLSGHGEMEQTLKVPGLSCPEEEWVMAMPLDGTGNIPGNLPSGFDIKRVATKEQLDQFADVLASSTTPPDENIKTFLTDTKDAAIAHNSRLRLYVGYVGETPTAILEAFSAHGIISFYGSAALASARGKGYAGALLINALREAKKAGLRLASLQTPEAGRPIYERLGFKPVGRIATCS